MLKKDNKILIANLKKAIEKTRDEYRAQAQAIRLKQIQKEYSLRGR